MPNSVKDIKEYIASGIIESYVMGMASEPERREFERLCQHYPELQRARVDFEFNLERNAMAAAVSPPAYLKDRVMASIQEATVPAKARVIPLGHSKPRFSLKNISGMRWAIAASFFLILACGLFIYLMHQKAQRYKQEMASSKEAIDKLEEKSEALEKQINGNDIKQVNQLVPKNPVKADMNVYWDSTNTSVYLVIKNLKPLPEGQKYQVWSFTKGNYKSLGLFDAPAREDKLILRVENSRDADSFLITVETLAELNKVRYNETPEKDP